MYSIHFTPGCFPALVYCLWWRGDAHIPEEVPVLNNLQLPLYTGRHRQSRTGVRATLLLPRRWAQTLEYHQHVRTGGEQTAAFSSTELFFYLVVLIHLLCRLHVSSWLVAKILPYIEPL